MRMRSEINEPPMPCRLWKCTTSGRVRTSQRENSASTSSLAKLTSSAQVSMPVMVVHWICTPPGEISCRTVRSGSPSSNDPANTLTR